MTPVPDSIALEPLAAPDAGFEELLRSALTTVQEQAGRAATSLAPAGAWTDHNTHDPGITILEACLWALADLHYRTGERAWETWPAEASAGWRSSPLPGAQRSRLELALGPGRAAALVAIAASPSLARAKTAVAAAAGTSEEVAGAIVRLLREPLVLRAALDRGGAITAAIESAATETEAQAAVAEAVAGLGLWPEEVDELLRREDRRALARTLRERPDAIRAAVDAARGSADPPPAVFVELAALGLDAAAARTALSLVPCPPVRAETWELEPDGETTLWPPHPLQVRTCEPVTAGDYLRLFQSDPEVARAWLVSGLAAGVRWDGGVQGTARPFRRGALTIVVEAVAGIEATTAFLRTLLRRALGAVEVDAPGGLVDHRTKIGAGSPRRLLGDELCVAAVGLCLVEVDATIEIEPDASTIAVKEEAESRLELFLSPSRTLPPELAPPAPARRALVCPDELEGPLPPPTAIAEFLADPAGSEREGGWRPGEPVRIGEVQQLLQSIPGVAGVELLRVRRSDATEWEHTSVQLDRFCVPALDESCLCIAIVSRRECGA